VKNTRVALTGVRALGLAAAIVLFVIAIFTDSHWLDLIGWGLAIVSLVLVVDEVSGSDLRQKVPAGGKVDRRRLVAKTAAFALATVVFFIGAIVDDPTAWYALGFLAIAAAVTFDHLADFAVLGDVIEDLTDRPAPAPVAAAAATPAGGYTCAKCGHQLDAQQKFCPNCGTPRA
jgi:hypothetical protein